MTRRQITTIEGLDAATVAGHLKALQKRLAARAWLSDVATQGGTHRPPKTPRIVVQGDQREAVKRYLVDTKSVDTEAIVMHG